VIRVRLKECAPQIHQISDMQSKDKGRRGESTVGAGKREFPALPDEITGLALIVQNVLRGERRAEPTNMRTQRVDRRSCIALRSLGEVTNLELLFPNTSMARTVIVTVTPPFTCGACRIRCCARPVFGSMGLRKSLPTSTSY